MFADLCKEHVYIKLPNEIYSNQMNVYFNDFHIICEFVVMLDNKRYVRFIFKNKDDHEFARTKIKLEDLTDIESIKQNLKDKFREEMEKVKNFYEMI